MDLICIEHSTQKQQNTHSEVHVEHSPGQITCWTKKWALINFRLKILSSIFSYHNTMRLEINWRGKKTVTNTNMWRLNNMLLNNQWNIEEIKEEIKTTPRDKWKQKHGHPKPMEHSSSKREVYSNTILPQETRKITNNLTLHLEQNW